MALLQNQFRGPLMLGARNPEEPKRPNGGAQRWGVVFFLETAGSGVSDEAVFPETETTESSVSTIKARKISVTRRTSAG